MNMSKKYPELPDRQGQIISFIKKYKAEHGFSPSTIEISEALKCTSTYGIRKQLDVLAEKGWLTMQKGLCRTIVLTEKAA
jgi:SOS-response transcriptional repressor LexA